MEINEKAIVKGTMTFVFNVEIEKEDSGRKPVSSVAVDIENVIRKAVNEHGNGFSIRRIETVSMEDKLTGRYCPRCGNALKPTGKDCKCGWKEPPVKIEGKRGPGTHFGIRYDVFCLEM
jgi:hypothetical protein